MKLLSLYLIFWILDIFKTAPDTISYRCSSYNDYKNHLFNYQARVNGKSTICEEWYEKTAKHKEIVMIKKKAGRGMEGDKASCIRKAITIEHRFVGLMGGVCVSSTTCNKIILGNSQYTWDISTCLGNKKLNDAGVK